MWVLSAIVITIWDLVKFGCRWVSFSQIVLGLGKDPITIGVLKRIRGRRRATMGTECQPPQAAN
jgi:hypothetical protein